MEELTLKAADGLQLAVAVSGPDNPAALVQIIHGAVEHKERYYKFMEYLKEQGFTAIISDNRGHGASVNEEYPLGHMDGYEQIIEDQLVVSRYMKSRCPGKKLHLFGHSFGSLLARAYIQKYDNEIGKLVLSGTVNYIPAVPAGMAIGKLCLVCSGKYGVSKLLNTMGRNGKNDSWVSANEDNLKTYRADPLCQYPYTNSAVMTMFGAVKNLHDYKKYQCKNKNMLILSVTGEGDPVTGGPKGLADTVRTLERAGYKNITNKVYPGMKHEVLNEREFMMVYRDIAEFLRLG